MRNRTRMSHENTTGLKKVQLVPIVVFVKRSQTKVQVNLFEYTDYRQFLRDWFVLVKKSDSRFSYRYIARLAGFKSPNFFKLVSEGQRNLTIESAVKLAKAVKLTQVETDFFLLLMEFNQTTDLLTSGI